jgi:hypothetical protein
MQVVHGAHQPCKAVLIMRDTMADSK